MSNNTNVPNNPHNLRSYYNRGKIITCTKHHNKMFCILGYHFTTTKRNRHYKFDNQSGTLIIMHESSLLDRLLLVLNGKAHIIN